MTARVRLAPGRAPFHYLNVISNGPLILLRTTWPMPRWRGVIRAITAVMRAHGLRAKDVSAVDGLLALPDTPVNAEDARTESRSTTCPLVCVDPPRSQDFMITARAIDHLNNPREARRRS
jgi:hypothetical protein